MRGGDSDAREEHHDIHTGESVRSRSSRYNNVTPGLVHTRPGRCTPHRRRANATYGKRCKPSSSPSPSPTFVPFRRRRMGGMGAMGSNPHGRDSSGRARPTTGVERGESERGRESGAATRSQFARGSPPLESPSVSAWMRVIGARRRVADWPRSHLDPRKRAVPLSPVA